MSARRNRVYYFRWLTFEVFKGRKILLKANTTFVSIVDLLLTAEVVSRDCFLPFAQEPCRGQRVGQEEPYEDRNTAGRQAFN